MWPFYSRKERRRREMLRAFSAYLTPEMVEKLVRMPERLLPNLEPAMIPYIILQVRDDDMAQVPACLEKAFEATLSAGGTIVSVMSSVVMVVFGIPIRVPDDESIAQRDQAVAFLRDGLGPNVRAVFGRADGLYGNVGSAQRLSYGALFPRFSGSLVRLLGLEFGESAEV